MARPLDVKSRDNEKDKRNEVASHIERLRPADLEEVNELE